MQNRLEPLEDYIFLTWEKIEKTKTGIILPDVSKKRPVTAKVVAAGPGRLDRHGNYFETKLKEGDVVVIDPFLPRELEIEGEKYLVLRESEIFARLPTKEKQLTKKHGKT